MPASKQVYRLSEARELRGLTVSELSQEIGVSRQAVYRYENGTQMPSPDILQNICSSLRFPITFFSSPRTSQNISDRPVFFRDMKTNQEKYRKIAYRWLQILCDQVTCFEKYLDLPAVSLPDFDISDPSELTYEDIDIIAERLRKFWGLGNGPIDNVTQLLENNGFIVFRKYIEAEKMDACSLIVNGRPYILVNTYKHTCSRDIMNLAHEVGHVILHQSISSMDIMNSSCFDKLEDQAWRFAKSFLMPPTVFQHEVGYPTLRHFVTLKSRWRTSIASMIMYCCDLGIIDEAKKQYFFREMTRMKIRKQEPLDDELPIESSSLLRDCESIMVSNGMFTKQELFESTSLNEHDYCELLNLPYDYLAPKQVRPILRLVPNN